MSRQWPPARLLSAGLTIGVLLALAAVYIATHLPRLGIVTEPGEVGIRVVAVDSRSGLHGSVAPGDELIALSNGSDVFRLEPGDAVAEPDDAPVYGQYNRFFQRQARIWALLQSPSLEVALVSAGKDSGFTASRIVDPRFQVITTRWEASLAGLPLVFWYQLACGLAIFWMGIGAWAFVQNERGPFYYALAGLALGLAIIASAIYTTRELAIAPDVFLTLSRVNQFGAMLFAGAGTTLLWYYPTRLGRFPFERFMAPAVALILAANWGQWVDSLDLTARVTLLLWAALDVVLAALQWRRTRTEPVARARLKWFIFAWFGGVLGYLGLVVVPQVLGQASIIHQQYAWVLFVFSYLGIAMGIVRFRLFDLDRWILMAWFWFLCGIMILALDAVLLVWLNMSTTLSLMVTLALVGWLYFPLRQLFMVRLLPTMTRAHLHNRLPAMIPGAFDAGLSIREHWHQTMVDAFQPLHVEILPTASADPGIRDNGLRLRVPSPSGAGSLELGYAQQGQRLFDREDLQFVTQALLLFNYAQNYRQRFQQGVMEERQRVARDLHDDVGARLLSVIYRAGETEAGKLARDCLGELRDVIQGLQKEMSPLDQSFARWHAEAQKRCQLFGVDLVMNLDHSAAILILSPRSERNLMRIIREFISNSLRHARASRIEIILTGTSNDQLELICMDDGVGMSPEQPRGVGLCNIDERSEELRATLHWFCPLAGGTGLICALPLTPENRP